MIHLLDEALESWIQGELRSSVGGRDIEVSFATPDREFDGAGPGPTINLFLWDIMKSVRSHSGRTLDRSAGDHGAHRGPDPVMEFRYLVSAWGTEVRDEHRLLGEITRAVMRSQAIAENYLAPSLRTVRPLPELGLGSSGGRTLADLWSAFDGQLRPGLDLVVVMTIDAHTAVEAGERIDSHVLATLEPTDDARSVPATDRADDVDVRLIEQRRPGGSVRTAAALRLGPELAGVRVTSGRSASTVGKDGTCIVHAEPGSSLTVHAADPFDVVVPTTGEPQPSDEQTAPSN